MAQNISFLEYFEQYIQKRTIKFTITLSGYNYETEIPVKDGLLRYESTSEKTRASVSKSVLPIRDKEERRTFAASNHAI